VTASPRNIFGADLDRIRTTVGKIWANLDKIWVNLVIFWKIIQNILVISQNILEFTKILYFGNYLKFKQIKILHPKSI